MTVPRPNIKGQKVGGGLIPWNFSKIVGILPFISLWNYQLLKLSLVGGLSPSEMAHTLLVCFSQGCSHLLRLGPFIYGMCVFLNKSTYLLLTYHIASLLNSFLYWNIKNLSFIKIPDTRCVISIKRQWKKRQWIQAPPKLCSFTFTLINQTREHYKNHLSQSSVLGRCNS